MAPKSKRLRKCTRVSQTSNDYMTQLPDAILQHILFFLPIHDAARVSTLSKTWFQVWKLLPVFSFSLDQYQLGMPMPEFLAWVNQSLSPLQNHKAVIQSFALKTSLSQDQEGFSSQIDNWVCWVMRNYIKELHINMSMSSLWYILPETTFASKSLVKLRLVHCKFPATLVFTDAQKFRCLQELYLMDVVADEDQIQNLINCFPSLEKLTLKLRILMTCLVLDNFLMLQYVAVAVKILRVNAPNLQRLCLAEPRQLHASNSTVNVKGLSCILSPQVVNSNNLLQQLVSSFPLLETLYLALRNNTRFRIQHSRLKTLHLYGTFEAPVEVEIDAPKLCQLYCNGSIFPSLRVTSPSIKECGTLELHIRRVIFGILDSSHIHQLGNFLQNFNPSIQVNLHDLCTENILTLAQLQEQEVISYPSKVWKLVLVSVSVSSDFTSFLDGLLWTCHPSTLLIKKCCVNGDNFIKFLCRELLGRQGNPTCCRDNLLRKCWRHFLKVVEVRYYTSFCEPEIPVRLRTSNLSYTLSTCDTGKEVEFIFEWLEYPVCGIF